jgi:hypothetical protein
MVFSILDEIIQKCAERDFQPYQKVLGAISDKYQGEFHKKM